MKNYLKTIKRYGIYLLIVLPVFVALTYLFALINLNETVAVVINVIIGALLCLLFEIIYVNFKKRNKKKIDTKDPFAD